MRLHLLHNMKTPVIRDIWSIMTASANPFLQYGYIYNIWKQIKCFSLYSPLLACIVSDKDEPLMLLPLKWDRFKRNYKMLADIQGCGQSDVLFNPQLSDEERYACVAYFYANINEKCRLNRLSNDSFLLRTKQKVYVEHQSQVCVKIDFSQGADFLLKTLSKSVRQNLRTAYNRMHRDNISYRLQVYRSEEMTDDIWNKMMKVYLNRLFTKHKIKAKRNPLYRYIYNLKYRYIKHDTKSLKLSPYSFHTLLYGNGHIMGFLSGLISRDGTTVVIPRLSIDNQYRFYSPGYILLAETLHWLDSNTTCRCLDLSRGDEQYKIDMGGMKYYTASVLYKP